MRHLDRPLVANFITTRNCNMDCVFCGVEHLSRRRRKEAGFEQVIQIVDALKAAGVLQLNYFGGEPLTYHDIERVVRHGKTAGFYQSMVTNGLLLTERRLEWLLPNIDTFAVSLHGEESYHDRVTRRRGNFHTTIERLKGLRRHTDKVTVNMTVTDNSLPHITSLIEKVHTETGITAFALNRCIGTPPEALPAPIKVEDVSVRASGLIQSLVDVDELSKRLSVNIRYAIHFPYCLVPDAALLKYVGGCGIGVNYLSVDLDGWVQMCSYTDARLGNILDTPLLDIWQRHPEYERYRAEAWLPPECKSCEHKLTCTAGCKMSSGSGSFKPDVLLSRITES